MCAALGDLRGAEAELVFRVFGAEWGGHGVDQFFQDAEGKIRKAKIGLKKQEKTEKQ